MPGQPITIPRVAKVPLLDIALDTLAHDKQALVFAMSKRSAEKAAEDIAKKIKTKNPKLQLISQKLLTALERPTKQCERLAKCAKKGTVFHHAGLAQKQREIIEDAFREGTIGIIACTPTLAYGVNLPSFRTLIQSMKRYVPGRGQRWIPVLEYLQYAGRSGRPDFNDTHGEVVMLASSEGQREELVERYIQGEPEEIHSKLGVEPVLRVHLLALIANNTVRSREAILTFFAKTFYAHQFQDLDRLGAVVDKILNMLEEWEFITTTSAKSDFVSANELQDVKVQATKLGKRVSELYLDPLTARNLLDGMQQATKQPIVPFSFIHLICTSLEMRPLLRVRTKEYDLLQDALLRNHEMLLVDEPTLYDPEYEEFLDTVKTALLLDEWMDERDEQYLFETYGARPGELRIKLNTADWLLYAAIELCKLLFFKDLLKELLKLRVRLEYGVKEELLTLLKLKGIGRVRSRQLYTAGFKTLAHIKRARPGALEAVLGNKLSAKVREQLGMDPGMVIDEAEITPKKEVRIGQQTLEQF